MSAITIEGYTADELLALSQSEWSGLILRDQPLVFRVGSAEILGRFAESQNSLVIELAHIDGGGEGALLLIGSVVERYVRMRNLSVVEWRVHAVNCARPNLKLKRVLERRGFVVNDLPGVGECYVLTTRAAHAQTGPEADAAAPRG